MDAKIKKILVAAVFVTLVAVHAKADLTKQIDAIIGQNSQTKVQFSINIIKANSGKQIYSHNANTPMLPASNMKIITTAAAIKYLGPNYEYITQIGLYGDTLAVIGAGDPLLGDKSTDSKYNRPADWIFDQIITALKQNGTKKLKDIIIDSSIFDDQRVHPNWPKAQLNRDYACEVSGLNYNGNCIDMTTKNIADRVHIYIEPHTFYVEITNKVRAISQGSGAVGAYRQPSRPNELVVKGKCKKQQGPFAVAIERPSAFFGFLLYEHLAKAGITTKGQLLEKGLEKNSKFKLLLEHRTPLTDCLARSNKNSFGLAAEAMLKTIAANKKPIGSWAGGQQVISDYLLSLGIEKAEFQIDDGSGLSRQNKLSANTITTVLIDAYNSKNWQIYKDSLAVGGLDGTIAKYFKDEKYKGRIFGKTGYIAGVKSFSGLCATDKGDYIFSILTNKANGKTRDVINEIAKAIIDQ